MKRNVGAGPSPLRAQAINTYCRAQRLPLGKHRNDLRQLAFALWHLHKQGMKANVEILDQTSDLFR